MLPPLSWSTAEETPLRISKYSRYCYTFGGFQERTSSKVVFTLIVFIWTSGWQWARGEQPRCAEQGPRRPRQLWAGLPQGISSFKINLLHVYNCHNSVFVHKKKSSRHWRILLTCFLKWWSVKKSFMQSNKKIISDFSTLLYFTS